MKKSIQQAVPNTTSLQQLLKNSSIESLPNQGKRVIFQDVHLAKSFIEELYKIGFENRGMRGAPRKIEVLTTNLKHDQARYAIDLTTDEWDALNSDCSEPELTQLKERSHMESVQQVVSNTTSLQQPLKNSSIESFYSEPQPMIQLNEQSHMKSLCIHLGFMPEELSAKLKPDLALHKKEKDRGVLIITRDIIREGQELFEQPFTCYDGLPEAIARKQFARVNSSNEAENGNHDICNKLKKELGYTLDFNVEDYRIKEKEGAKAKLKDGKPELSIIHIGQPLLTDIYLQFPEMGFQSTLAFELVKGIFNGLFKWLESVFKNDSYDYIRFDVFGAGGSLHKEIEPGSKSEIKGALSIRRFLTKNLNSDDSVIDNIFISIRKRLMRDVKNFKSKTSLHLFKPENKNSFFLKKNIKKSLLAQEMARFYYISLAKYKLQSENPDDRSFALANFSQDEISNLKELAKELKQESDNLDEQLRRKIQGISLENSDWAKVEFQQDEVKCLSEFLNKNQKGSLSAKLQGVKDLSLWLSSPYFNYLKNNDFEYQKTCKLVISLNEKRSSLEREIAEKTEELDVDAYNNLKEQYSIQRRICIDRELINKLKKSIEKMDLEINTLKELKKQSKQLLFKLNQVERTKEKIIKDEINKIIEYVEMHTAKNKDGILRELEQMIQTYPDHSISCSASFFLDETIKLASNILLGSKAADANMEDDLVIRFKKYVKKRIDDFNKINNKSLEMIFECLRINCDPFEIDENFKNVFEKWAKEVRYSLEDYVNAILWRAGGFDSAFLIKAARWTILDMQDVNINSGLFFKTEDTIGNKIVIDPFWREIATDFLADICEGKAFTATIAEESKQELQQQAKDLKNKLNAHNRNNQFLKGFRNEIENLVQNFLNQNGYKDNEKYKIWIRKGSWGGNSEQMLDQLWLNSANIDRALYISTNIIALQIEGEKRTKELRQLCRASTTGPQSVPSSKSSLQTTNLQHLTKKIIKTSASLVGIGTLGVFSTKIINVNKIPEVIQSFAMLFKPK